VNKKIARTEVRKRPSHVVTRGKRLAEATLTPL
jgi:hypothetical protein